MGDESRGKRRASEDEWTANKKRALSSTSGSPMAANGVLDDTYRNMSRDSKAMDEPEKEDDLEVGCADCRLLLCRRCLTSMRQLVFLYLSGFVRQQFSGGCDIIRENKVVHTNVLTILRHP